MFPIRLKNGMKPSLFPVQISTILNPLVFRKPQSAAPKPLSRLFLDPSYGPENLNYIFTLLRHTFTMLKPNYDECHGGVRISWVHHASEINSECSNPCCKGQISFKQKQVLMTFRMPLSSLFLLCGQYITSIY